MNSFILYLIFWFMINTKRVCFALYTKDRAWVTWIRTDNLILSNKNDIGSASSERFVLCLALVMLLLNSYNLFFSRFCLKKLIHFHESLYKCLLVSFFIKVFVLKQLLRKVFLTKFSYLWTSMAIEYTKKTTFLCKLWFSNMSIFHRYTPSWWELYHTYH